uniref:Transposase n=1 Tax=Ditylenchus dipsaci TaxID=166011 RepID=A0A915CW75_9BILA
MENLQQMKNSNNNSVSRKRPRKDGLSRLSSQPIIPILHHHIFRGLSRFIVDGKCSYKDPNTQTVCGYSQTPSNIARHFARKHSEWKETEEVKLKAQQTLLPFPVISSGQTRAQRLLSLLTATSTLPVCFVEKDYFKQLLGMIPGFVMPSRRQLNETMECELQKMQKNLLQLIKDSPGLAMSADIGSTRNNKHSFLLIMAHLCNVNKSRLLSLAFDIIPLQARHTGVYIAEVRLYFSFCPKKCRINFSAFKQAWKHTVFRRQWSPTSSPIKDLICCSQFDQLEEEEGDDKKSPLEDLFAKLRHIDCSAHRLQNSIKDVYEKKGSAVQTCKKRIFRLVGRFHKSHLATHKLGEKTKLALILPSATRWNYIAMVYRRLIEIHKEINEVCFELGWEEADGTPSRLTTQDIHQMRSAMTMLGPLMNFTIRLQEESSPTISLLLPGLNSILEEYKVSILSTFTLGPLFQKITPNELVKSLSQNIRTRFAEYLTRFGSNEDVTVEDQTGAEEEFEENDLFGVGSSASWALEPAPNSLAMEIAVYFEKAKLWGMGKKDQHGAFGNFTDKSTNPHDSSLVFGAVNILTSGIYFDESLHGDAGNHLNLLK